MCEANHTAATYFLLLGFQNIHNFKIILFVGLLFIYICILVGNMLIIIVVLICKNLRHPMYIFLQNLAVTDMLFASTVVPHLLNIILLDGGHIFIPGCFFQAYMYSFLGIVQSFLLTAMSYDRYLAICDPLHYSSLMNIQNCYKIIYLSWLLAFILDSSEMIFIFQLQFCYSNIIDHFFCDLTPVLAITSSDTFIIIWEDLAISLVTILLPFICVIASYICIIINILKMSFITGRKKAFSTCSSHLLIVCIYYGTLTALYILPSVNNFYNENKFKSLIYILISPFSNPLIYSVRNKELLSDLKKLISKYTQRNHIKHSNK